MKKLTLLILTIFFIFSCGDEETKCKKGSCSSGKYCNLENGKCEKQTPCKPNPCVHGSCTINGDSFKCTCEPNFEGDKCDQEKEENTCEFGTFDEGKNTCVGDETAITFLEKGGNVLSLGLYPNDMTLHDNNLYVVNSGDNNIQKIDLSDNESNPSFISLDAGANPYEFVLKDDKFYISNSVANSLAIFNLDGTEINKSISFEGNNAFFAPQAIAVGENNIFLASTAFKFGEGYSDGFITVINKDDNSFSKKIMTGQRNPQAMLIFNDKLFVINTGEIFFDPNNNYLATPKTASGIDVLDLTNLEQAPTNVEIPIVDNRGSLKSYALCNDRLNITGAGLNLYSFDYNSLEMIHSTDDPIVIENEDERKNHLLALTCIKNHLFIVDGNTDKLYVMDKDNKVVMKLEEIDNDKQNLSMPQKLVYDEVNNKLYIMFGIAKKIAVVDLNKL